MKNIKKNDPNLVVYFEFLGIVLLLTGFSLWFYCLIRGVDPLGVDVLSSPVHYLVLGLVCVCVFVVKKWENKSF